jgi:signal transduction histidine kinase/CheY-like chemotaxis protein
VNKISAWLGGISALLAVSLLAFLVKKSLPINSEEHQRYLQALQYQDEENILLGEEIIQSKYEIVDSYNILSDRLTNLQDNNKKIQNIPDLLESKDLKLLQKNLQEYSQKLDEQERLISQFKTENAVIKNSLGYLPVLLNDLHKNLQFQTSDRKLFEAINEILHNLILYNNTSDRHLVPVIQSKLERLKQLENLQVLGSDDPIVKQTITHASLILDRKPKFEEIAHQLYQLNLHENLEDLISIYELQYRNTLKNINQYRIYAFICTLAITITIAYLIISNLSKTNRSIIRLLENFTEELESKVDARTLQLATSVHEAEKARFKAEQANKAKSRFLANMSHELRTPLNAILGFTQIMNRDRSLTQENQYNLGIISRSGEHLLKLINDILEMSKIESGQATLNKTSFDLYRLLDSLEEMFLLRAKNKNLQLLLEKSENLPTFISTDEGKLTQILINLLGNALKFTEEGGVMLRVDYRQNANVEGLEVSTLDYLYFEVEDTGPGINNDEIDKLFIPFEQTETGRKSQEGTGLGLPISQKFVQLMGGEITVKSTVNRGSIFSFQVLINLVENTEPAHEISKARIISLAPDQPEYRILAVDDRPESRLLLVKLLSSIGFQVEEAGNGQEAVELWQSWQPHLILMDMRMPIMTGYEATKIIKSSPQGISTIIVALTASAFEEERAEILDVGCDDFLRKPFREEILLGAIGKHLNLSYLYEDPLLENFSATNETKTQKNGNEQLTSESLSIMSLDWLEKLLNAAEQVDNKQLFELIEQIPSEYASTANNLSDLVRNFRCDKIIDLFEKAR